MRTLIRSLQIASIALGILLLPAFVRAPYRLVDTCAGVGLSGTANWISCAGNCDVGACKVGNGSDAQGAYKFCGCGTGNPTEPSCCHLVARKNPQTQEIYLAVRGLCTTTSPACALEDGRTCQLVETTDPEQPACLEPPQ